MIVLSVGVNAEEIESNSYYNVTVINENGANLYEYRYKTSSESYTTSISITDNIICKIPYGTVLSTVYVGELHGVYEIENQDYCCCSFFDDNGKYVSGAVLISDLSLGDETDSEGAEETGLGSDVEYADTINETKTDVDGKTIDINWSGVIVLIISIISIFILWNLVTAYFSRAKCPKCRTRKAREKSRKFIKSEKVYFKEKERIEEYNNTHKHRTTAGKRAATNTFNHAPDKITVREALVEGERVYYDVTYVCQNCGEEFVRREYWDKKPDIVTR